MLGPTIWETVCAEVSHWRDLWFVVGFAEEIKEILIGFMVEEIIEILVDSCK